MLLTITYNISIITITLFKASPNATHIYIISLLPGHLLMFPVISYSITFDDHQYVEADSTKTAQTEKSGNISICKPSSYEMRTKQQQPQTEIPFPQATESFTLKSSTSALAAIIRHDPECLMAGHETVLQSECYRNA